MKVMNPRKPHNFEPRPIHQKACKVCGASKRNPRLHPNEDDYR